MAATGDEVATLRQLKMLNNPLVIELLEPNGGKYDVHEYDLILLTGGMTYGASGAVSTVFETSLLNSNTMLNVGGVGDDEYMFNINADNDTTGNRIITINNNAASVNSVYGIKL